ncbi:MAG: dihydroorotate dehydrogenase, partial [Oscillospiraceae bacterium]|nr:dihydroorotate dehydrogenase [Oscillospiraceae bacterium]
MKIKKRDLSVTVAGVKFANPVIAASGTFGFGEDYNELYPIGILGGISCKGLTLEPRDGNAPARIAETPAGMLNSVGLQNPGVDYFIEHHLAFMKKHGGVIIANFAGGTLEDYVKTAQKLDACDADMLELNISCPNVKEGGAAWGVNPVSAAEVTSAVRAVTKKPLMVKLTPNVSDITEIARAVEAAGADAISLINTLLGMRIDIRTRRPILRNNVGGLSGAAVFPVALRMVWQVASAVKIDVVGIG